MCSVDNLYMLNTCIYFSVQVYYDDFEYVTCNNKIILWMYTHIVVAYISNIHCITHIASNKIGSFM